MDTLLVQRGMILSALVVESEKECEAEMLCVVFFDVGQGDAVYIESPTGTQVLIDGGPDNSVLRHLGTYMGFSDRDIDMVVATHPDSDHIGGLTDVLKRYEVEKLVRTNNDHETATTDLFDEREEAEGAEVIIARRGQSYDLGGGAVLEVLFPDTDATELESNTSSVVLMLSYGEHEFLLPGDAPKNIEEYLVLMDGEYLESEVLKVGHHGSRTSTSELFIEHVRPHYAVVSAAADNPYGHPHVEVTDILFNAGAEIIETGEAGNVVFVTDGVNLAYK